MLNKFYNAFDYERLDGKSSTRDFRSPFQVDRDRVLHTPSFRSLQSKTQVFWSGEYDFYRTRLTHSLEVAQIGKSMSNYLNKTSDFLEQHYFIDTDLVEAICLSHDLGHPPFGHAGEKTLNTLMQDAGGFEGNAQTLRLLTERIFSSSGTGMFPTRAFLDGVLKYKTLWSELKAQNEGATPKNHFIYDEQQRYLDWVYDGGDFLSEFTPGEERDSFRSVECEIMDWADDIAYSLNDLVDSVRAGFINLLTIEKWAEKQEGLSSVESAVLEDLLKAVRADSVEVMAARKIGEYLQSVELKERANSLSGMSQRYRYTLKIDQEKRQESCIIKRFASEVVFSSTELNQLEYKGNSMICKLWDVLEQRYVPDPDMKGYSLLPESIVEEIRKAVDKDHRRRLLCDYFASLTDGSCRRLFQRLFSANYGSINDLL